MFPPHEVYSKSLVGDHGFPLWTPQLKAELPEDYQLDGLKIGDVGIVSPVDGSFDVLFNITLPRNRQPYPRLVREGFVPVILDQENLATQHDAMSPHDVISSASMELTSKHVYTCRDQTPARADYEFSPPAGNGAVLILPEGAQSCDLQNERIFLDEAIRHAVDWFECATGDGGRLISNNSLYLITGIHKAHSWSLGAVGRRVSIFPKRRSTSAILKFKVGQIHNGDVTAAAYSWEATHGFKGRVGPMHPYEISNPVSGRSVRRGVPNQTVFIRGFRITVNKRLFFKAVSIKARQQTHFKFIGPWSNIANLRLNGGSESAQSSSTQGGTDNTVEQDFSVHRAQLNTSTHVTIHRVPDVSETFHPGDLINRYMLKKEPHAMVALTHDSLWIEMLRTRLMRPADFSHESRLRKVLSKNYRMVAENGAVYLQRCSMKNSVSQTSETATLQTQAESTDCSVPLQGSKSARKNRSKVVPGATPPDVLSKDNIQTPDIAGSHPEVGGQAQGNKEKPGRGDWAQQVPSLSGSATHTVDDEETIITSIRATGVALGLRRVPAGFYAVVHHNGLEWKTENKRSLVTNDVVEWIGLIPMPSDLSATICLEVYACFEFQPMLGAGEQLRKLTVTVERLLDHSARDISFTFLPEDGDIISPCSSISVTLDRRKGENNDSSTSGVISPRRSSTESRDELEEATNRGHSALSLYRKHGEKRDLECSIKEFERALSICPRDHPCCAAAQSNLAMAKFIFCQVEDAGASLKVPLNLCHNALAARPVGHDDRPSTLLQLATILFARFDKWGDGVDRAQAEALLHESIQLGSAESHENKAATFLLQMHANRGVDPAWVDGQSLVKQDPAPLSADEDPWISSIQLLDRFEQFGDLVDLQQAIGVLEKLVVSTSADLDDWYRSRLANLGVALWFRFNRLGELCDLEDAISRYREAIDLTPLGHPYMPVRLNNLGNCFVTRFEHLGMLDDLEYAISRYRGAVSLTDRDDPDKPVHLNNLGSSFSARFERVGELRDLEEAVSLLRNAVDLTPRGHPHRPVRLNNLGNCFITRFEHLGMLSDVEVAILQYKEAVDLTPHDDPDKPIYLNNLGNSFSTRFDRLGVLRDLQEAVSVLRNTVDLTPRDHPHRPVRLNNLGNCFVTRFERLGKLSDLEDAISTLREAVDLTPHNHPHRPGSLSNLGNSLITRFERLGKLSDLEDAILTLRDAVNVTPRGHSDKPGRVNNLGNCFFIRFERLGKLDDLDDAILSLKKAVDLTPHSHPHRPSRLNNLGNSLRARFERLGGLGNLEDAISTLQEAADLTPHDHPHKPDRLNNLGNSLRARFERIGELGDLKDAISTLRNAICLTPDGHPNKPGYLSNLGDCFSARFERLGELRDLEEAISTLKEAVNLTPDGHPERPARLNSLGNSLVILFRRRGETIDIEKAVSLLREAVDLTPDGHPERPARLNSLGNSLVILFKRYGEISDIKKAVSLLREAVDLTYDDHPERPTRLNSLGNSLVILFKHRGEISDIEKAVSLLREAVDLTYDSHPERPARLNSLGNSLVILFKRCGEISDIEKAVSLLREAVDLTPDSHPNKPAYLNNLGISLTTRFENLGVLGDLEDAISTLRTAVDLTPDGHPDKPGRLSNLGNCFIARFQHLELSIDLDRAISLYSHATFDTIGPIIVRLRALQQWIWCARRVHHRSLLSACSAAITLLPQLAWSGLPLTHRYSELSRCADVAREAAATALEFGLPETAVEWLEQGRSVVWGELLQLRSSYEELSVVHPSHACRLRELSAALEHASAAHEKSLSAQWEETQSAAQRTLAIERDKLVHEIRGFPGFERFLFEKKFSQLRVSAHSGPVVILNAAENRCDALIILADVDHAMHIPLPNITSKRLTDLRNVLKSLLCHDGKKEQANWESLLSALWTCVVKPVLDVLTFSTHGDPSRIFWCPAGPFMFLPIHAAGFYDPQHSQPGHKISDFVVSSYVPSLSVLALSTNADVAPRGDLRLLAVRQPPSDGLLPLRGIVTELEYMKGAIKNSTCITLLEPSIGTVEEVLGLMKETDWVHFACCGIQDTTNSTNSGLCLADQHRLKLSDIMTLSRPRGGLAFLSASQTMVGDERLPDEAIHVAAAMLFAGYGGVIGTMWSIPDSLAPRVTRDVYEELFRNGTRPDYREAARALQRAVGRLRDSGASFIEWVPFIHLGL